MNEDFQRHLQLGRHLYDSHLYERAAAELGEALVLAPHNNFVRLLLARALLNLGQESRVYAEVKKALEYNPEEHDAYYLASFVTPSFEQDLAAINTALHFAPWVCSYHVRRAHLLCRLGYFPESLESGRQALEINPESVSAHCQLVSTLFAQSHKANALGVKMGLTPETHDEANRHIAAALRIAPEDDRAHALEAELRLMDQEYERALEEWHETLRLNPNDGYARYQAPRMIWPARIKRFKERVWNLSLRWIPWPIPLPLLLWLNIWTLRHGDLTFWLVFPFTCFMWSLMLHDWLRFIPDRFLRPSLRRLKNRSPTDNTAPMR